MFEITYHTEDIFDNFKDAQMVPQTAVYDFSFEDRMIIFHLKDKNGVVYIALDTNTGKSSQVKKTATELNPVLHRQLIPHILNAMTYLGDRRYTNVAAQDPMGLIDLIFRTIMPEYGYSVREDQIKLAKNMYNALSGYQVGICEAEVGAGKTMAYLVAGFVARKRGFGEHGSRLPVTITTSSIELQKAIVEREIPKLSQMLMDYCIIDTPLTVALRKGKEHYFCKFRFDDYLDKITRTPDKYGKLLHYFDVTDFKAGALDLDPVNIPNAVKKRICVKDSCSQCKYRNDCRYHIHVRFSTRATKLDYQVTNHNLYLQNAKMQMEKTGKVLQNSNYVIVDEAHKLKSAAMDVFGSFWSEDLVQRYCGSVKIKSKDNCKSIYADSLAEFQTMSKRLFRSLREVNADAEEDISDKTMIRLTTGQKRLISKMAEKLEAITQMQVDKAVAYEISAEKIKFLMEVFVRDENLFLWLEEDDNGNMTLCAAPKDMGGVMATALWERDISHVLTSGTMSDGRSFTYFKKENGIDKVPGRFLLESTTPSPFDYRNHTRLFIPRDVPFPNQDDPEYIRSIAKYVLELVEATNGHTAVLFTSYKALQKVYDLTAPYLEKYELICMSRGDKTAIARFKRSKNAVLFASGSMWEGVDCVGDCLSSVIIVRLPFPMRTAISEMKKEESVSVPVFVREYAVPEMLIKLRQGCGRLVRSETDTGLISILDSRCNGTGYSASIDHALKKYPRVNSIQEAQEFMRSIKDEAYFG